jgi:putative 4-mercaptohistidine N1-methyltranferase
MSTSFYETDAALAQYLLFHYGTPEQICPLLPEARGACGFPVRCVTESLRHVAPARTRRALDLGCAVGRSSFELACRFDEVIGIDFSARFIEAAHAMQRDGAMSIRAPRGGATTDEFSLTLPADLPRERVRFEQGDACALRADLGVFDLLLMANLIDRLPDPARCLAQLPALVAPGGALIITSPYTWLEEYTPRDKWLDQGRGTLATLREKLAPAFSLNHAFDLPMVIRDHHRKAQWTVTEASVWQRSGKV